MSGAGSGLTSRVLALANGAESKTIGTTNLPASGLSIPSLSVSGTFSMSSEVTTGTPGGSDVIVDSLGNNLQKLTAQIGGSDISWDGALPTRSVSGSTGTSTTGNMGSGNALDIMNPMQFLNVMVKL